METQRSNPDQLGYKWGALLYRVQHREAKSTTKRNKFNRVNINIV